MFTIHAVLGAIHSSMPLEPRVKIVTAVSHRLLLNAFAVVIAIHSGFDWPMFHRLLTLLVIQLLAFAIGLILGHAWLSDLRGLCGRCQQRLRSPSIWGTYPQHVSVCA